MLETIYTDSQLLVLNKPADVSVLADRSGAPCLWEQLQEQYGKVYLVHRLDKGTSGVLLVSRSQALQSTLTRLFQQHQIRKYYRARVCGELPLLASGHIDLPLQPGRKSRFRIAGQRDQITRINDNWVLLPSSDLGKPSQTRLRRLDRSKYRQDQADPRIEQGNPGYSELLLAPKTGRTHQLRVHLAWIGYPIVGDTIYGRPKEPQQRSTRMHLHCRHLSIPGLGSFVSPVPW